MYVYDPSSTVFTDKYNLGLRKWMDVLDVYLENANCWNLEFPPHILQVDNISCGIYVCYQVVPKVLHHQWYADFDVDRTTE